MVLHHLCWDFLKHLAKGPTAVYGQLCGILQHSNNQSRCPTFQDHSCEVLVEVLTCERRDMPLVILISSLFEGCRFKDGFNVLRQYCITLSFMFMPHKTVNNYLWWFNAQICNVEYIAWLPLFVIKLNKTCIFMCFCAHNYCGNGYSVITSRQSKGMFILGLLIIDVTAW